MAAVAAAVVAAAVELSLGTIVQDMSVASSVLSTLNAPASPAGSDRREDAFSGVLGAGRGTGTRREDISALNELVRATIERWQCTGEVLLTLGLSCPLIRTQREIRRVFAGLAVAQRQSLSEQERDNQYVLVVESLLTERELDNLYVVAIAQVAGKLATAEPGAVLARALSTGRYLGLFGVRGARFARLKDARAAAAKLSVDDWTRLYELAISTASVSHHPESLRTAKHLTKELNARLPSALTAVAQKSA